jgi:hypothetical protein
MAYTPPPIIQRLTPNKTLGRSEPVRAIVNHRMVGTLPGTDSVFANADRNVSTHFGIGYTPQGKLEIHQYVALDDTAWGNGTAEVGSNWADWGFKNSEINAQTISIEHQDIVEGAPKGVVPKDIQQASQWLQALLLRGHLAEWKRYGLLVRDWNNQPILDRELGAIPRDGRHIITHNDISPRNKPYCWKPWSADTIGFPRATYVTNINKLYGYTNAIVPDPVVVAPPPPPPVTYTEAQLQAAVSQAISTANAEIATLKTQLAEANAQTLRVKQELKSHIVAFVQSL